MRQLFVILPQHMCFLITWAPKGTLAEKVGHLKAEASTDPATLAKKLLPMTYFHEFTTRVAFANLWDTHICENKIQITNSRWMFTPNESDTVLSVKPLSCRARVRAQTSRDFLLLPGKGPFLHRLEHKTKKNLSLQGLKTINNNMRKGKKHSLVTYLRKYIWEENHVLKTLLAKSFCSFNLWGEKCKPQNRGHNLRKYDWGFLKS